MRICPMNEDELDKQDASLPTEPRVLSDTEKAELWQRMQELCQEPN